MFYSAEVRIRYIPSLSSQCNLGMGFLTTSISISVFSYGSSFPTLLAVSWSQAQSVFTRYLSNTRSTPDASGIPLVNIPYFSIVPLLFPMFQMLFIRFAFLVSLSRPLWFTSLAIHLLCHLAMSITEYALEMYNLGVCKSPGLSFSGRACSMAILATCLSRSARRAFPPSPVAHCAAVLRSALTPHLLLC